MKLVIRDRGKVLSVTPGTRFSIEFSPGCSCCDGDEGEFSLVVDGKERFTLNASDSFEIVEDGVYIKPPAAPLSVMSKIPPVKVTAPPLRGELNMREAL